MSKTGYLLSDLMLHDRIQTSWGLNHAIWFFAMGAGGALYIESLMIGLNAGNILGVSLVELLSWVIVAIGGSILIADLGRPERFVKALSNVTRSWISVGAVADFIFLIITGGKMASDLNMGGYVPFGALNPIYEGVRGATLSYLTAGAAFIVMVYAGIVLAVPRSVPFWHTSLIPTQFVLYSLNSALAFALVAYSFTGFINPALSDLELGIVALTVISFVLTIFHLSTRKGPAALSVMMLLRGDLSKYFTIGVLVFGLLLPTVIAGYNYLSHTSSIVIDFTLGIMIMIGSFLIRWVILKAGVYPPILEIKELHSLGH